MWKLSMPVWALAIGLFLCIGCQNASDTSKEKTVDPIEATTEVNQRGVNEGRATKELIRRLEKNVVFTEDQKSSIGAITKEYNFDNLPREQRRQAVEKIIAKIRQEVLTPKQIEQMKQRNSDKADSTNDNSSE